MTSTKPGNPDLAAVEPEPAELDWTDLDRRTVDVLRALAMDAVEEVGNGHPGTAMSLAPAAFLLYQRLLRHDPSDPNWLTALAARRSVRCPGVPG